ncbi:alpha/beta fold hydrolase [Roseococcus sp. SYP-B2431]|uniref:alpha/beta fold hydrolase n=1 Tax=Roseococcus sp. SYP-B2431 TaxID=2496640 RepID=UPI00103F817D|nr:alpha/beta fold hydrolase [Roseococcus sp. SYP-B2431]TCH97395.1 alpha/beta fold hydrolase [Roseococcus sp. SYP-B2431]
MPRPLLLLPGLLCDGRLWRDCLPALAGIADPRIADLARDDSVAEMASRALDLVEGEERFAVAGLSMGGYVALEVWRQARGRITHLALLDTSARPDTEEQKRRRRALMALSKSGQFRGVTPRLLPSLIHPSRLGTPLAEEVMEMAARVGHEGFLRQQLAIMGRPDSRPDLPEIDVPTLVACGEDDVLTPPALHDEMAALIPGARRMGFARTGHLPTMEVPEEAGALLRGWLAA